MNTTTALAVVGISLHAAGGVADLALGRRHRAVRQVPYLLMTAGSVALVVAGTRAVLGHPGNVSLGTTFGFGHARLVVDGLAGLFLTVTSAVAAAVSLALAAWCRPEKRVAGRGLGAAAALLLISVTVILLADEIFVFLFAWELLTLAFFILASYERRRPGRTEAGWVTLVAGKVSGAFLLIGFLLLVHLSHSFVFTGWQGLSHGTTRDLAYALILVGFGIKVGVVPFHVWIPRAYAAAPGPIRAGMAAVAVNVGFYGMWRMFGLLGAPPEWLVILVLVLGGITALLGVLHAAVATELDRLIAYSSIENGGLIVTAFGIALAGAAHHSESLVALGLLAATLQMFAHAVAKASLFLGGAFVEASYGTADLNALRGVGRTLPWSGATLGVGALTLAGLPPTIGFVSEWFILEALLQQFRLGPLSLRLTLGFAGALVALTAGLAALTFVRLLGISVLGAPDARVHATSTERDAAGIGKLGLLLVGTGCLLPSAFAPIAIRFAADGLRPIVSPGVVRGALASPLVLQPVFRSFSVLSPSWLWIAMPVLVLVVTAALIVFSARRVLHIRRVPAWRSASGHAVTVEQYTSFGYANPLRNVLANALRTQRRLELIESPRDGARAVYTSEVSDAAETLLYRPLRRGALWLAGPAKRMQSGRLEAYLTYMLIAFVALLAVVAVMR